MDEAGPNFSAQSWSSTTPEFASKTSWRNLYHFIDQNADNKGVGKFPQERPLSAAGKSGKVLEYRYNNMFAYLSILNRFSVSIYH